MKRNTLLLISTMCLAIAGTSVAATNNPAHDHKQEQGAAVPTLQFNAGKKWETDAALRQSMSSIRQAMAAALDSIHNNRFSAKGYAVLAQTVEMEVGNIVANCKLAPKADEQLHLIVADLLEGAGQMGGKAKAGKRQDGAVRVIGALDNYGSYFDDPGFKPIEH